MGWRQPAPPCNHVSRRIEGCTRDGRKLRDTLLNTKVFSTLADTRGLIEPWRVPGLASTAWLRSCQALAFCQVVK